MKFPDSRRILEALRNASSASRNAPCPSCGLALVYVDATLSLYGSDESVAISLGFCERCDGLPVPLPVL
jgi:C4-type Zn-finger protein